jgi:hypothetical protein
MEEGFNVPLLGDVQPPPTKFSGEVDTGWGSPQKKKSRFDCKLLPAPPNFGKTIVFVLLKVACPQIPQ